MSGSRASLSLAGSSLVMLAVRVIGLGTGFLTTALLARSLPAAQFGTVATAMSIAFIGALVLSGNLGASAIRFLPGYQSNHDLASMVGYLRLLRLAIVASLFISWSVAVIYALLQGCSVSSLTAQSVVAGLICVPCFALIRTEASIVHALGNVVRASVANLLIRPILFGGCVLVMLATNVVPSSALVLLLFVATAVATCACQYGISSATPGARPSLKEGSPETSERRAWLQSGLGLLFPTLFLEFVVDLTVLISAIFLSPSDTATVGVVMRLQSILMFGVTSISMTAAPLIARAHASKDVAERTRLISLGAHIKLWPSLVILIVLFVFAEPILGLFGEHYRDYGAALRIVGMTPLVLAIFGPTVLFTTVLNLQAQAQAIFSVAFVALVVLIGLGGLLFGVNGVAAAVLLTWIGWNAALHHLITRSAGFSTSPFIRG